MTHGELLSKLTQAVLAGDEDAARAAAQEALDAGIDPLVAIEDGSGKAMRMLGDMFAKMEVYLPELILGADAMKASMEVLVPKLKAGQEGKASRGKVVIGTVAGDIHDIGKNVVAVMLAVNGFEVYDLGNEVPSKKFIEKAQEVKADIIALSSLMTTSAYYQPDVIKLAKDMGIRSKHRIIVGGGPVTSDWATKIGADGYARTSNGCV